MIASRVRLGQGGVWLVLMAAAMLVGCEAESRSAADPSQPVASPPATASRPATTPIQLGHEQLELTEIPPMTRDVEKTQDQWREQLTPEQYRVVREKGTERPFTGKYDKHYENGTYHCIACGAELFGSGTKFDSGCGWPSFSDVANNDNIELQRDPSLGMNRVEVLCKRCGAHLGHVFEDGPKPTGLRYCINSVSLDFRPE